MARIYLMLALCSVVLLIANLALGLSLGDYNQTVSDMHDAGRRLRVVEQGRAANYQATDQELSDARKSHQAALAAFETVSPRASLHRLLGVGAALMTILVNSITVTYFVGTNRWCREVADSYSLGDTLPDRSTRLKRASFPWSLLGITATLAIAALGAASDPTAILETAPRFVSAHYLAAWIGIAVIAYAFLRQLAAVGANYEVIDEILGEVRRIRREKGLDDDENGPELAADQQPAQRP